MGAHAKRCKSACEELRPTSPVPGPKALDKGDGANSPLEALSQGVVSGGILAERVQARIGERTGEETGRRGLGSHKQVHTAEIPDKGPVYARRAEE